MFINDRVNYIKLSSEFTLWRLTSFLKFLKHLMNLILIEKVILLDESLVWGYRFCN